MSRGNGVLARDLLALAVGMLMLAYASVPLYRLFCEATGFGGTPRQASAYKGPVLDRRITVRFNADTDPALPWEFKPGQVAVHVRPGENMLAFYEARNLSAEAVTGRAVYNVVPHKAGAYFDKVECFCFTEQTLAPHQQAHMPVSFFLDPALAADPEMNDVNTITLSYTFFPVKNPVSSQPKQQ